MSVVQQAQTFFGGQFYDMDPCGPRDVSGVDEDFSNTSEESLGAYKNNCHSLSSFKMRSG